MQRHVHADGAVAVPLAALVAALHPLDEAWRRGRGRGRQSLHLPVARGRLCPATRSPTAAAATPSRSARLTQRGAGGQGGERLLPAACRAVAAEDAVDVERLAPRAPRRPVAAPSGGRAGLGLAAGALVLPDVAAPTHPAATAASADPDPAAALGDPADAPPALGRAAAAQSGAGAGRGRAPVHQESPCVGVVLLRAPPAGGTRRGHRAGLLLQQHLTWAQTHTEGAERSMKGTASEGVLQHRSKPL